MIASGPVSYTHLDVYKRQALDVAYATSPGSATISPVTELVTTIAPPPLSLIHI